MRGRPSRWSGRRHRRLRPCPGASGTAAPERELWPWLLALLVLVLVGLGAGYLVTRKDKANPHLAAPATTTVVETQPAAGTAPTRTAALPRPTSPTATKPGPSQNPNPAPAAPPPQRVAVPNVLGIPSGDAVSHLRSAGLGARVQQVFSEKPAGTVVAQSPDPSTKADKGSAVTLQVSKGPRRVVVPDVGGQDQQ